MQNLHKKVARSFAKKAFSVQPILDISLAPTILEVFFEHLLKKHGKTLAKSIMGKVSLFQPTTEELSYLYKEFLNKEGKKVIKVVSTETQGFSFLPKSVNKFLLGNPFSRDEAKLSLIDWSQALQNGKVSPYGKTFGEIEFALLGEFKQFLKTAVPLYASWKVSNYVDGLRASIISSFKNLFFDILSNSSNAIQANFYIKKAFFSKSSLVLNEESFKSALSDTLKTHQALLQKEVVDNLSAKKIEDVLKGFKKINTNFFETSVDNHFLSWLKGAAKTQKYTILVEELPFNRF